MVENQNWPIIGHEKIVNFFTSSLSKNSPSHAYLFSGPPNVGKTTVAKVLAQTLQCERGINYPCGQCYNCQKIIQEVHPDVSSLSGRDSIKIEEIRDLIHSLNLKPYSGNYKIAILENIERMTAEASNSLLKTLEEPSEKTIIILTCEDTKLIFPTIVSRCQIFKFGLVEAKKIENWLKDKYSLEDNLALELSLISGGRPGIIISNIFDDQYLVRQGEFVDLTFDIIKSGLKERLEFANSLARDPLKAEEILNFWLSWFRDAFLVKQNCLDIVINSKKLEQLKEISSNYTIPEICNFLEKINNTRYNLKENINNKLLLEVLVLNFKAAN